jgi:hypothetical protein
MSLESSIFDALKALVSNRVYPDVAPENTARPYITYQQVGGEAVNFVDTATTPSKKNARFQINCWADTRAAAATLAGQVEAAIRGVTTINPTVLGAPVAVFDLETKLRGTRQDFSVWG